MNATTNLSFSAVRLSPKALMALGIPIMIGMLINALYNLADALCGWFGKKSNGCYFYRISVGTSCGWFRSYVR